MGGQISEQSQAAAPYLLEYYARMELKKLGFTDSLDDLDCITAEAFMLIGEQIARAQKRALDRGIKNR